MVDYPEASWMGHVSGSGASHLTSSSVTFAPFSFLPARASLCQRGSPSHAHPVPLTNIHPRRAPPSQASLTLTHAPSFSSSTPSPSRPFSGRSSPSSGPRGPGRGLPSVCGPPPQSPLGTRCAALLLPSRGCVPPRLAPHPATARMVLCQVPLPHRPWRRGQTKCRVLLCWGHPTPHNTSPRLRPHHPPPQCRRARNGPRLLPCVTAARRHRRRGPWGLRGTHLGPRSPPAQPPHHHMHPASPLGPVFPCLRPPADPFVRRALSLPCRPGAGSQCSQSSSSMGPCRMRG